ncbi:hypothetical protein OVA24_20575 [Luteolibacter sp. SL250]|uniref:hypothetical protein n=1 Tax=Luteolibacter sp. SL250 TaxID=2995170 RepID=UPI0022705E15|nr:hypothetical protein [Luteolibacter sp. SL250]WAC19618.1 hypothetical protein OVA24_20575 [Luteolibacter sp. SL250]
MRGILQLIIGWAVCMSAGAETAYVETRVVPSRFATQAAAVDGRFIYAVASKEIAKLDRADGKELALSEGEASHLNSAVVMDGKIYCAHSNFPLKPEKGKILMLDPATMKLEIFHEFSEPPGSLTWALRKDGSWWCHFAHYGKDNGNSVLVRYDADWKETGRWTYPPEFVAEWGKMSLSGAVWQGGELLANGHDKKRIYRLKVPEAGKVVEWVATHPSPFPGQGIALDPETGGLVGIDRKRKSVVFAETGKP